MLPRAHEGQRPPLAAGEHARAQRREQAGAQCRGLAAPRRADDRHERCARQARHHPGHQPLAPEEHIGVLDIKRGETLEGTRHDASVAVLRLAALSDRLQLDHVAREVILGRAQTRALARRASCGHAQAPCCLRAGPLGCGAVHPLGDTAAGLGELLDRHLGVVARIQTGDRGHAREVQRPEPDHHRVRMQVGQRTRVLSSGEHEHGQRGQAAGELVEQRPHLLRDLVDVVEHEQRRAPCRRGGLERGARGVRQAGTGRVAHDAAVAMDIVGQLGHKPRLAHPAPARDQDDPAGATVGVAPVLAQ